MCVSEGGYQLMAPKKVLPFLTERVTEELLIDLRIEESHLHRNTHRQAVPGNNWSPGGYPTSLW